MAAPRVEGKKPRPGAPLKMLGAAFVILESTIGRLERLARAIAYAALVIGGIVGMVSHGDEQIARLSCTVLA